jgi:hypothetical protein
MKLNMLCHKQSSYKGRKRNTQGNEMEKKKEDGEEEKIVLVKEEKEININKKIFQNITVCIY